mmetsp:Transcript_34411/g.135341  ORF Transcript_34411/g.135341 Transcript_34411/m.135341 type:complete len:196 (+) Transcript_34411:447-1034(+)
MGRTGPPVPGEKNAAADLVRFLSQTTSNSNREIAQNRPRGRNFSTEPMTFRRRPLSRPNGFNRGGRAYLWTNSHQRSMRGASNIDFKTASKSSLQSKELSNCSEFEEPKKSASGEKEETAQRAHQKISRKTLLPRKALRYNVKRLIMGLHSDSKSRTYEISHTASATGLPVARSLRPSSAKGNDRHARQQQRRCR